MQVNVAGLRRNIKNLAHNYSDAQVKVREATSNDPWGPSAAIMAEIADLTFNVVAFSEIMQMIWKRLNDHGKNWRHVYKALILLEYLIKTGTEKVAQQCKENIFAIQTLREFVYYEEGKDQGTHVREKAKQLVNLLKDDERLKNERIKALKAKERFAQHPSGFGSDGYIDGPTNRDMPPGWQEEHKQMSELELVRPQTAGEEELQLKLAMAMSREEAEQEEAKRRSDDVRLQLALSQSEQDFKYAIDQHGPRPAKKEEQQSHLVDLLDISLGAASISSPPLGATGGVGPDPWVTPARAASQLSDPWSGTSSPQIDPWQPAAGMRSNTASVPLGAGAATTTTNGDAWALRTQSPSIASGSSTEGWSQSNGTTLNGNTNAITNAFTTDPWLGKSTMSALAAAQPSTTTLTGNTNIDPWLTDAPKPPVPQHSAQKSLPLEDPWAPIAAAGLDDPWKCLETAGPKKTSPDLDEFDVISNRNKTGDLISNDLLSGPNNNNAIETVTTNGKKPLKTPQAFLGENSSLVNLDNLIKPVASQTQPGIPTYNPFSDTVIPPKTNLFQQQQPTVPSINQLKQQQPFAMSMNQDPWAPVANPNAVSQQVKDNPFSLENYGINPSARYATLPLPKSSLLNDNGNNTNSNTMSSYSSCGYAAYNNCKNLKHAYLSSDSDDDVFNTSYVPFHFLNGNNNNNDNNNNISINNENQDNNDNENENASEVNNFNQKPWHTSVGNQFSPPATAAEWNSVISNSTFTERNIQYHYQTMRSTANTDDSDSYGGVTPSLASLTKSNTINNLNNSCLYPYLRDNPEFKTILDTFGISENHPVSYATRSRLVASVQNGTNSAHDGSLFSYGFYDGNVSRNDYIPLSANRNSTFPNSNNNINSNNNMGVGWLKPDAVSSNPFLS